MEQEVTPLHPRSPSFHDYLRLLVKRRWTILAVFLAVVVWTALQTFTATPIYQATIQMLIERHQPRVLETQAPSAYDYYNEEFYQTQYKLLESRALAKKVADKLNLRSRPPYAQMFAELPADVDKNTRQRLEESLVDVVLGALQVEPVRASSLVNVSYSSPDPKFAAEVANTLGQAYIEQSLDLRFAASQEAAQWLEMKLAEARKKMEASEAKLNQYKRQHNIVALEDKESITAQKLEQLNKELVSAQTKRMEAEARFREVDSGRPIADLMNNPLIQTLKAEEAKLITEHSELSKKFGEGHPRMIQINQELVATRGKINAEMGVVRQTIQNEYNMARSQEANLKKALDEHKNVTQDQSDVGIQYRVLLRDVETNRALYDNMLKSLKSTTATENVPATNIRIVYPPLIPETPISPRKARNLLMGAGLGLALGVGLALLLEGLDTTIKTPEEVESYLGIPHLAMIPHIETAINPGEAPELVVLHGDQPLASEAYRVLRTSILFSSPGQAPKSLLVTSTMPMEGKTLTTANLATAMAKAEGDILLIDADLRRPTLHQLLNVPREPGLSNFLVGETDELPLVPTLVPHLYLMPAGAIPPNPSELLGSERMQELLNRAQERFGRTILDSPPLVSVTDAAILSTLVSGVLMVIKVEHVPRKAALDAVNHLEELHARILGVVLNDVPLQRDSYYYRHYKYYSSYYAEPEATGASRRQRSRPSPGLSGWLSRLQGKIRRDS
ncbi:MAG: polysaccharide biosynthesis tyrosine autokinase [Desulfobaccales bacterium]